MRDVFCEETMNTTVLAGKRITMQRGRGLAHLPEPRRVEADRLQHRRQPDPDRPLPITGGNMYFVWTGSLSPARNVLLNCMFRGHGSRIQPHMRWSTGMLVDNCTVPDGGIDFMNRGVDGLGPRLDDGLGRRVELHRQDLRHPESAGRR